MLRSDLLKRLYVPLTYDDTLQYLNCWFIAGKSIVTITQVNKNGIVLCSEKSMEIIRDTPSITLPNGGTTIPHQQFVAGDETIRNIKGRMVYSNILKRNVLWVNPFWYELSSKDEVHSCIPTEWKPGCQTNLGKYGKW